MSSNFGQIGPLTTELAAVERLKNFHRLITGKIAHSFLIDSLSKLPGNQDRHKSSDKFDFGPLVTMTHLYVFFKMRFDLGTLNSDERSLPLGYLFRNLSEMFPYGSSCVRPKMVPVRRQIWPPAAIFDFHGYRISSEST